MRDFRELKGGSRLRGSRFGVGSGSGWLKFPEVAWMCGHGRGPVRLAALAQGRLFDCARSLCERATPLRMTEGYGDRSWAQDDWIAGAVVG